MGRKAKEGLEPAQALVLSFLATIIIGTIILYLPISTNGERLSLIDALFTATSATCVTGLIVVDTGSRFNLFGQLIILLLIQLGGLGIMTFSTLFALMLGKKIRIRDQKVIAHTLSPSSMGGLGILVRYVVIFTFAVEAIGALLLYLSFSKDLSSLKAVYYAIFHSISAFCNSGFSLFRTSFMDYHNDLWLNLVIISLVIIGGIGFIVVTDIFGLLRGKTKRLSLHSRVVLILSFGLIILGTVLILLFESTRTLSDLPVGEKLICSLFHAVTPRTAGFNTLETRALAPATLFLTIILMFIGGSPGSTAGGIKTTTLSILLGIVKARIHDREEIELFKRRIPQDIAHRALAIVMLSICLVVISTMSLLLIEKNVDFLGILFEATSAFGTVGLSTGITPHLSFLGKITIILTMFIGRVGPLTLAFAIGRERPTIFYRYPEEKVVVG